MQRGSTHHVTVLVATVLGLGVLLAGTSAQQSAQQGGLQLQLPVRVPVAADIALNEASYETWRDHILPDLSELAWEDIPWRITFEQGILDANAEAKPLLLWTMNGHPLGCT